jgi:hypothetical protein
MLLNLRTAKIVLESQKYDYEIPGLKDPADL